MEEIKVLSITFVDSEVIEEREIKVKLNTGSEVTIIPCHSSWEQYGGSLMELRVTQQIAERYNDWLHGDEEIV